MLRYFTIVIYLLFPIGAVSAGVESKAVQEAAEVVSRKFGKQVAEMGLESLTRKMELLSAKYGDDALVAVEKVGPRTFRLVEEAGEDGLKSVKLLARFGDEAIWVVGKKNRMAIFIKYGDNAAEAMMKQGQIAEPLISSFGEPAIGALKAISTRNGRRLAIMADDGTLNKMGRTDEVLAVAGKYGDRAMEFIWKNKGGLAVATTMAAFLANPQPFIDGTVELTKAVSENIVKPVATEAAKNTAWTFVLPVFAIILGAVVALKVWLRHRRSISRFVPTSHDAA